MSILATMKKRSRTACQLSYARCSGVGCGGCELGVSLEDAVDQVLFCDTCFDAVHCEDGDEEEIYWFVNHLDHGCISWSSHPSVVAITPPPLGPSSQLFAADNVEMALRKGISWIQTCDAVLVTAGAGCSMDSGLPDFRGRGGWYDMGESKIAMDNVDFKPSSEHLVSAWRLANAMLSAFHGAVPHEGYSALVDAIFRPSLVESRTLDAFVVTSNIDGYFARAGVSEKYLYETHGCLNNLQCTTVGTESECPFAGSVWPISDGERATLAESVSLEKNTPSDIQSAIPRCQCGALARPNVSHSTDSDEDICESRKGPQRAALLEFLDTQRRVGAKLVVLELGCGVSEHSLRGDSEIAVARHRRHAIAQSRKTPCRTSSSMGPGDCWSDGYNAKLIRVDPASAAVPEGESHVGLPLKAKEAIVRMFTER
jgi:NAD-dependent SIR2 family protein deacetylase